MNRPTHPDSSNLVGLLSPYLKKKRLQMVLPFIPRAARILDIGCDNGALVELLPVFEFYFGLDSREGVILRNRQRYHQSNISFACQNFEQFNWHGAPFNLIVMTAVLEHLEDFGAVFSRLTSISSQDGLLLITTPALISRFVLQVGAAIRLFARDSLKEHKNYFRKVDFQNLPGWELLRFKRFEFGMNQMIMMRKGK